MRGMRCRSDGSGDVRRNKPKPEKAEAEPFWAIVEVMGHNTYAGEVSERALAGGSFVRVDVPAADGVPAYTKLLGVSSIYAITPCSEAIAKAAAKRYCARPFVSLDIPINRQLPSEFDE